MDRSIPLLFLVTTFVRIRHSDSKAARTAERRGGDVGNGGGLDDPFALQLRVSVPFATVPTEPAEDSGVSLRLFRRLGCECVDQLGVRERVGLGRDRCSGGSRHFVVGWGFWAFWIHSPGWLPIVMDRFLNASF